MRITTLKGTMPTTMGLTSSWDKGFTDALPIWDQLLSHLARPWLTFLDMKEAHT